MNSRNKYNQETLKKHRLKHNSKQYNLNDDKTKKKKVYRRTKETKKNIRKNKKRSYIHEKRKRRIIKAAQHGQFSDNNEIIGGADLEVLPTIINSSEFSKYLDIYELFLDEDYGDRNMGFEEGVLTSLTAGVEEPLMFSIKLSDTLYLYKSDQSEFKKILTDQYDELSINYRNIREIYILRYIINILILVCNIQDTDDDKYYLFATTTSETIQEIYDKLKQNTDNDQMYIDFNKLIGDNDIITFYQSIIGSLTFGDYDRKKHSKDNISHITKCIVVLGNHVMKLLDPNATKVTQELLTQLLSGVDITEVDETVSEKFRNEIVEAFVSIKESIITELQDDKDKLYEKYKEVYEITWGVMDLPERGVSLKYETPKYYCDPESIEGEKYKKYIEFTNELVSAIQEGIPRLKDLDEEYQKYVKKLKEDVILRVKTAVGEFVAFLPKTDYDFGDKLNTIVILENITPDGDIESIEVKEKTPEYRLSQEYVQVSNMLNDPISPPGDAPDDPDDSDGSGSDVKSDLETMCQSDGLPILYYKDNDKPILELGKLIINHTKGPPLKWTFIINDESGNPIQGETELGSSDKKGGGPGFASKAKAEAKKAKDEAIKAKAEAKKAISSAVSNKLSNDHINSFKVGVKHGYYTIKLANGVYIFTGQTADGDIDGDIDEDQVYFVQLLKTIGLKSRNDKSEESEESEEEEIQLSDTQIEWDREMEALKTVTEPPASADKTECKFYDGITQPIRKSGKLGKLSKKLSIQKLTKGYRISYIDSQINELDGCDIITGGTQQSEKHNQHLLIKYEERGSDVSDVYIIACMSEKKDSDKLDSDQDEHHDHRTLFTILRNLDKYNSDEYGLFLVEDTDASTDIRPLLVYRITNRDAEKIDTYRFSFYNTESERLEPLIATDIEKLYKMKDDGRMTKVFKIDISGVIESADKGDSFHSTLVETALSGAFKSLSDAKREIQGGKLLEFGENFAKKTLDLLSTDADDPAKSSIVSKVGKKTGDAASDAASGVATAVGDAATKIAVSTGVDTTPRYVCLFDMKAFEANIYPPFILVNKEFPRELGRIGIADTSDKYLWRFQITNLLNPEIYFHESNIYYITYSGTKESRSVRQLDLGDLADGRSLQISNINGAELTPEHVTELKLKFEANKLIKIKNKSRYIKKIEEGEEIRWIQENKERSFHIYDSGKNGTKWHLIQNKKDTNVFSGYRPSTNDIYAITESR